MKETTNNYENIGGVLNTTKFLLNKLKQRDYTDRALIGFAFIVYLLSVDTGSNSMDLELDVVFILADSVIVQF
ncbi:hypothetical protein O9G_006319 [Rozella allomycis CSF55]|uniref:Uncharacterized protein n=1 Tax=Rozella allomycis (strain CSF55) TaxID=988480 RepID=A0A075B1N7_ROZAC|nr:hypothetical protein O9G_006319 [Rozella allomycis CSF55]|eukprot:EPZ36497.1 hypothetical protein O9G_006319 [Rozella allomycis CSF55]